MTKLKLNDNVIFKQRTARHLGVYPKLPWEYEEGHIVYIDDDKRSVNVCWLQGHHSRNDDVPIEDVVAVYDPKEPSIKIGNIQGCSKVLQEIVKEGQE